MRLIADKLSGERGGGVIFSEVDFALEPCQALVVTGPNGSGKSTLLRIVAGLLPPAAGRIGLEGADDPSVAAASHYLGHQNGMKTALTVAENLRFWCDFYGDSALPIAEALEMVALDGLGHLPFAVLSTGQKRRAAIARLLISRRPVWLLDEPTSGLDAASEMRFAGLMREHLRSGGIVIAATHLALGLEGASELRMGEYSG
ncbi:heme ABC exporter ATP-binding protein CcmA [Pseudaminobacter sp. 19-2017]|uniref:Heme ABC exporter ATP-binding protein CcmA n=1 Tax=Pseudaminobacter soli (ex Zhang et al. 2022) TaxID=2831468 RepID=A0A942I205_9HYPH|nr:heme ABC exporter ATP-binding protein CcmA [Pseudaminobacter soli]MBS3647958.1 heme ABC exporter ATP-binding protein CcmA [Pseudaminobacter soli]